MSSVLKSLVIAIFPLALVTATSFAGLDTNPDGSINFGSANRFTVLAKGDASFVDDNITGPSKVVGNIGIGGSGNFSMSDGDLYGDIYIHHGGKITFSGPANQHGFHQYYDQDAVLNQALGDAQMLSDSAAAEMASSSAAYTVNGSHTLLTTVNSGQNMTVADSNPFGSKIVLNLTDFVRTNGTFTLQGTAMTTYIINVSRNFSLNNSSVMLSGGLLASHVLFNVRNGGGQVSLNQGTELHGSLVAMGRKVDLSGGKVLGGRVMANQVVITSGGQVISE